MTATRLFVLGLAALLAPACDNDGELGPAPPVAGLRFVNAVPDTGAMDFRVVDLVGDAPQFLENTFRSATQYQAVQAGARHLRVFITPSRTDTVAQSALVWDTTFTFTANVNYTVLMTGYARVGQTPALRMLITADDAPAPGAQVGLRVVHAGAGLGSVDVYRRRQGVALPGTAHVANLAFGGATTYATMDTITLRLAATAAGTTTPALADVQAPTGVAGTPSANPIAGSTVAGSVLTAVLVPRSVAGSQAPQTSGFTAPTILFVADRRPAMTVP